MQAKREPVRNLCRGTSHVDSKHTFAIAEIDEQNPIYIYAHIYMFMLNIRPVYMYTCVHVSQHKVKTFIEFPDFERVTRGDTLLRSVNNSETVRKGLEEIVESNNKPLRNRV